MSVKKFEEKEKRIPRIVSHTIGNGEGVAKGCSEGVVSVSGLMGIDLFRHRTLVKADKSV